MSRRRFAVALVIPPPEATEIDGLRRALGDRQLGRIEPHITIIPPINLHDEQVSAAMAVVSEAAAGASPLHLALGPVTTFAESSPVRFLAVDPWAPVVELHEACWTGVFDRERHREFHPHVTVDIDGGPTDRPDPAVEVLGDFRVEVLIDRLSLLEHRPRSTGREPRWEVYVSHRFGLG